jgi:hypothetical protein
LDRLFAETLIEVNGPGILVQQLYSHDFNRWFTNAQVRGDRWWFQGDSLPADREDGFGTAPPQVTPQVERLLAECVSPKSRFELQQQLGLSDKKHFRAAYLNPSLNAGLIELTNLDKPCSRLQKYRLTEKGRSVLEQVTSRRTWIYPKKFDRRPDSRYYKTCSKQHAQF